MTSPSHWILVVEADPAHQQSILQHLHSLGHTAETAASSQAVIDSVQAGGLKEQAYALVLMDFQLAEAEGFRAALAIRRAEAQTRGRTPIVAMTANAVEADRELCLAVGMDDCIARPPSLESLRAALARWLPAQSPPQAQRQDAPVDWSVLDRLRDLQEPGEPDVAAEVIEVYLKDSAGLLESMRAAARTADAEAWARLAHRLKGGSLNVGARRLGGLCQSLEELVRAGQMDAASAALSEVEAEHARVAQALKPD